MVFFSRAFFSRASLLLFVRDIDMLIMLIDHLTLLSVVTLVLPCFVLTTSHV